MRFRPTVTNLYQIWQANSTCLISASLNDPFCGVIWATERLVLDLFSLRQTLSLPVSNELLWGDHFGCAKLYQLS